MEKTVEELLAKAKKPAADAMVLHPYYRGKMQTISKCCGPRGEIHWSSRKHASIPSMAWSI